MIETASIPVVRNLRYSLRKGASTNMHLVYLFHGYGQLARYFLEKAVAILPEHVCFVAPEGMHRFYKNGTSGRVGASWMTKEARELDIAENTKALDVLHQQLLSEMKPEKITVIGFSQGGATAARWIASGKIRANCFVSWASVFPPDLSFPKTATFQPEKNVFVVGNQDVFFDEGAIREATTVYHERGFDIIRFDGGHDLDMAVLEHLINNV